MSKAKIFYNNAIKAFSLIQYTRYIVTIQTSIAQIYSRIFLIEKTGFECIFFKVGLAVKERFMYNDSSGDKRCCIASLHEIKSNTIFN